MENGSTFLKIGGPEKGRFNQQGVSLADLLAAGVLGDGLGAFADGVLSQFTWEQQPDGGLNLSAGDSRSLVVVSESGGFSGNSLEDVIHKTVHD